MASQNYSCKLEGETNDGCLGWRSLGCLATVGGVLFDPKLVGCATVLGSRCQLSCAVLAV